MCFDFTLQFVDIYFKNKKKTTFSTDYVSQERNLLKNHLTTGVFEESEKCR